MSRAKCSFSVQAEQLQNHDDDDDGANDVEDRVHVTPPCARCKSRKRATQTLPPVARTSQPGNPVAIVTDERGIGRAISTAR